MLTRCRPCTATAARRRRRCCCFFFLQVIDVLHPNKATVSKKDLKDILAKEYKVNGQNTHTQTQNNGGDVRLTDGRGGQAEWTRVRA